jgi:hypothetical protein
MPHLTSISTKYNIFLLQLSYYSFQLKIRYSDLKFLAISIQLLRPSHV